MAISPSVDPHWHFSPCSVLSCCFKEQTDAVFFIFDSLDSCDNVVSSTVLSPYSLENMSHSFFFCPRLSSRGHNDWDQFLAGGSS